MNHHHSQHMPISDPPNELESQFILRLPEEPAIILHDILKNPNSNAKDRIRIRIEPDMRHGTFYLDSFTLPGKIVDLPCIIESHKTIDRKNIYKTADIAQMMICSDKPEEPEEEPKPVKKKDGIPKVDKKYLYPHGITPPLKNVRKRRFRKTLKKKQYMDQPEIEKEVRRLLRQDYEAHHVSWEVVDEDEDKTREGGGKDILMQGSKTNEDPTPAPGTAMSSMRKMNVEHIFGEALSDSDLDEEGEGDVDMDDESQSRLSMDGDDDSQSQSNSMASYSQETPAPASKKASLPTSFSGDMFSGGSGTSRRSPEKASTSATSIKHPSSKSKAHSSHSSSSNYANLSRDELLEQRNLLRNQLNEINTRKQIQEAQLSTIENIALRQRVESGIEKSANDQIEKEREIQEVDELLSHLH